MLDASAVLDQLLGTPRGGRVSALMAAEVGPMIAPHLIDLEVAQVLRRLEAAGQITPARALQALNDHRQLGIVGFDHSPLLPRIWELRANLTAYDAAYVALAEATHATLVTSDAKLAGSPGHSARVHLVS